MRFSVFGIFFFVFSGVSYAGDQYEVCYCLHRDEVRPNNRLTINYCDLIKRGARDHKNFLSRSLEYARNVGYDPDYIWHESSGGFKPAPEHYASMYTMDWRGEGTEVCVRKESMERKWMVMQDLFYKHGLCDPGKEYPDFAGQVKCAMWEDEEFFSKR